MAGIPESRSVRVTQRGKAQTSYWKARTIAERSLSVREMTDEERRMLRNPERLERRTVQIDEERFGQAYGGWSSWRPQVPRIFAELDRRPFQSNEQFLHTLERRTAYDGQFATDQKPVGSGRQADAAKQPKEKPKGRRELQREEFADLLTEFDDI